MSDVKRWLVEGSDDAETFVDLKWTILEEKRSESGELVELAASHPQIPILLRVIDAEASGLNEPVIRVAVETGLETADLEPEEKLKIYRYLLTGSSMPLVKFYLAGPNSEVVIAVDLDKRTISKGEFEEALASVMLGIYLLKEIAGEALIKEALENLLVLVGEWYKRGVPRSDALTKLVRSGLERELAEKIVEAIYGESGRGAPSIYQ